MAAPPLPSVGGSSGVWGTTLNTLLTYLETQPGTLLSVVNYSPGSQINYNANISASPYYAVIDATNATISFTVPASGNFYIHAGIDWGIFPNTSFASTADLFLGITLHGSINTLLAPLQSVGGVSCSTASAAPVGIGGRADHTFYVSGYAPGALQADLVMGMSNNTNIAGAFYVGPTAQPAIYLDPVGPIMIMAFAA